MLVEKYASLVGESSVDLVTRDRVRDILLARKLHLFAMRRAHGKDNALARSLAEISHRLSASTREMTPHDGVNMHRDREPEPVDEQTFSSPRKSGSSANISRNGAIAHRGSHDSLQDKRDTPSGTAVGSRKTSIAGSSVMLGAADEETHQSAVKFDTHFMKKIPPGAEAANILVGEVDFLQQQLTAFVRLSHARLFGELTEVPLATRYMFVLLVPRVNAPSMFKHHEIGRSIATLMSDEVCSFF